MSGGEINEALDGLGHHDDCLQAMSRLSLLAQGLGAVKAVWRMDLRSPPSQGVPKLDGLATSIRCCGGPALSGFQLGSETLSVLGQLTLVSAVSVMLRRRLGVRLDSPHALAKLKTNLPRLGGPQQQSVPRPSGLGRFVPRLRSAGRKLTSLPVISPANLVRLGVLASANAASRQNLGINIMKPNAGFQLGLLVEKIAAMGFFDMLRSVATMPADSDRLLGFGVFSEGLRTLRQGFGIDLLRPKSEDIQRLPELLEPDGRFAILCDEVVGRPRSSLSPALVGVSPDLSTRASLLGAISISRTSLGLDLHAPDARARVSALIRSLEGSGVCNVAKSTPIGSSEMVGFGQLRAQAASVVASRRGMGIDLLRDDAKPKIDIVLGKFASNGGEKIVKSVRVPPELMYGLGELAKLIAN